MGMKAFASFIVSPTKGGFAATTRAADRGESGKIGLPGGKIDKGESALQGAIREAEEEGFLVYGVSKKPIHKAVVDGKLVLWFRATFALPLDNYKEKGRIRPITTDLQSIVQSGYGNEFLKDFKL